MTVIRINPKTVPSDGGDEFARRFAGRAGAVDQVEGMGWKPLTPSAAARAIPISLDRGGWQEDSGWWSRWSNDLAKAP